MRFLRFFISPMMIAAYTALLIIGYNNIDGVKETVFDYCLALQFCKYI
jgi:hypothetical protein